MQFDLTDAYTRSVVEFMSHDHLPRYRYDRSRLPTDIVDCIEAWIAESYSSPRPFWSVQDEITDAVARYHRERMILVQ